MDYGSSWPGTLHYLPFGKTLERRLSPEHRCLCQDPAPDDGLLLSQSHAGSGFAGHTNTTPCQVWVIGRVTA